MADKHRSAAQLYLVTPQFDDRTEFAALLDRVLQSAPVAALLIAPRDQGDASDSYQNDCKLLVPVAQKHGTAALTLNDTRISGRAGADGIHLTGDLTELKDVIGRFQPKRIVGAGAIHDRHDAMEKGEALPDYLLFGNAFAAQTDDHDTVLELAAWWADLFEIPCVAMAGGAAEDVENAVATGADFIGLNSFVWLHQAGPEAAIKAAHKLLQNS